MNPLAQKIAEEILREGPLSFARFMELALYCPEFGYYEKEEDNLGQRGDYYTSVSVGPLFGQLLASAFSECLSDLTPPPVLIEAGAHNGQLAFDILTALRDQHPGCFEQIRYWLVEPSIRRQEWQRRKLADFERQVVWVDNLKHLSQVHAKGVHGIIFTNELLDAMPLKRFGWDSIGGRWREWGVEFNREKFVWTPLPGITELPAWIATLPRELLQVLPNGFVLEHSESALKWWAEAAGCLAEGRLLAFDYGMQLEELLIPERPSGTLRAYRRHQMVPDVLNDPGGQDLTAHVNFSNVRECGEAQGLQTLAFTSQSRFLTGVVARPGEHATGWRSWDEKEKRQFQTLTHPQFLGNAFKVLIQGRKPVQ